MLCCILHVVYSTGVVAALRHRVCPLTRAFPRPPLMCDSSFEVSTSADRKHDAAGKDVACPHLRGTSSTRAVYAWTVVC
ncbi:hypothetical protein PR003_g13267 [Phytophthora rubi]|uniref:Secreted protein n=1 Tax=Phytophthora rubi TaxID=129364 RepID=A0A6A3LIZ9_9STRA|nr:hypothetical protein PR002_g13222 [Phytophthora rubi]KAE9022719.1 hypothetical protein PR001_g13087 [Phytophthora rubi]KAE9334933.1 hypothetical protein PR003_g13267 [Phytophthora rubi]